MSQISLGIISGYLTRPDTSVLQIYVTGWFSGLQDSRLAKYRMPKTPCIIAAGFFYIEIGT